MNEFYLNSTPESNRTSELRDKKVPSEKNNSNPAASEVSFQEVLRGEIEKAGGSPEVRQDLVEKFRASLANGTYEVKAQELAEKMIQKIRENKTREIM